jgi:hypothetical protein
VTCQIDALHWFLKQKSESFAGVAVAEQAEPAVTQPDGQGQCGAAAQAVEMTKEAASSARAKTCTQACDGAW